MKTGNFLRTARASRSDNPSWPRRGSLPFLSLPQATGGGVKAAQTTGDWHGGNGDRASLQGGAPTCERWPRG